MSDKGVNSFENLVDLCVAVSSVSPAFDDACIVTENDERAGGDDGVVNRADEKFKGHGFGPSDVPGAIAGVSPAWDKSPGSPSLANSDSDSNFRASIRKGLDVHKTLRWENGSLHAARLEFVCPPI